MKADAAILMLCVESAEIVLDTIHSVEHYCKTNFELILVDDGTKHRLDKYLLKHKKPNWHIIRNEKNIGRNRMNYSIARGLRYFLSNIDAPILLKLDVDALIINHGVLKLALDYHHRNQKVGMYGVYEVDYNRPRSYKNHQNTISRKTSLIRRLFHLTPSWTDLLRKAEKNGYVRGDNVFGGAYFLTRSCIISMEQIGALNVSLSRLSILAEDVYFSMATLASGFSMGHFAFPSGPLILEWKGLPYPAAKLIEEGHGIVHSVDKGPNTGPEDNEGQTAREVFRKKRETEMNH
ncbi:glycosyltransferase [Ekhidna sp.]